MHWLVVILVILFGFANNSESIAIGTKSKNELSMMGKHAVGTPVMRVGTHQLSPSNGFAIQSASDGYLISNSSSKSPRQLGLVAYGLKAGLLIAHALLAVVFGMALTAGVCSLAPVCSFSVNAPTGFPGYLPLGQNRKKFEPLISAVKNVNPSASTADDNAQKRDQKNLEKTGIAQFYE
ncbi:hypothetical protein QAD02_022307 [Eretmocerus hayati]|uniref:Uncharacterized protein n=1 Tax=Eretmocerus hayati TaxID=131215 RepID=A0ACC2PSQ4_9HYME|nr:hypothetical protein QAD02_022307 [Eretmocerus hayati]